ncbi:MAG: disulfide bond formation protein DsbA [Chloroflexi bacterium HGW-Chloroflexi-4]|jgi:protein-disulfide isomerase|nr:MAG: disulfide bond formation protein DsbA [Chloroflexi bacterium HGW-Chloroflexi-4]
MVNNKEVKRRKSKKKRRDLTPFIIIGVLAVVVLGVIFLSTYKPVAEVIKPTFHSATITEGLSMGDPNAPVKLVEFGDFQCPGCGSYWSNTEPDVIQSYVNTGKVFYSFSPFSFVGSFVKDNPYDESIKAAEAAYCANDQGKFWEYRDYLFANQIGENQGAFSEKRLLAFAENLSLEMDTFTTCLKSAQHYQDVMDDNEFATNSGINQTPSFTINGVLVEGDLISALEAAVNK